MEITAIEKERKRRFALLFCAYTIPIAMFFVIVDVVKGYMPEAILNILLSAVLIGGFFVINNRGDVPIYRVVLGLLSVIFFCNTIIGAGNGSCIYWLFPFPLVFIFFLGKNEGTIIAFIFLFMLGIILINPLSFRIFAYDTVVTLRLLVSLLLVTLMSYALEASRQEYGLLLTEKHDNLRQEKQSLETAMARIKTLKGLIPICSNCKKIRDDKGYWQQVEVYMRDHSDADFSHGLCPDCMTEMFPGHIGLKRKHDTK